MQTSAGKRFRWIVHSLHDNSCCCYTCVGSAFLQRDVPERTPWRDPKFDSAEPQTSWARCCFSDSECRENSREPRWHWHWHWWICQTESSGGAGTRARWPAAGRGRQGEEENRPRRLPQATLRLLIVVGLRMERDWWRREAWSAQVSVTEYCTSAMWKERRLTA